MQKAVITTIRSEREDVVVLAFGLPDKTPEAAARKELQRYADTFRCVCSPDEPPEPTRAFMSDLRNGRKAYSHFTLRKIDGHEVYQIIPETDSALNFFMLLNHWQTAILERNMIEDNGKRGNRPAVVVVGADDCLYMKSANHAKTP